MNLFELVFGAETMERIRARTREMQAEQAAEVARMRERRTPMVPAKPRPVQVKPKVVAASQRAAVVPPPSTVPAPPPQSAGQVARDEARLAALVGDFPTSILETAPVSAPPLLAAFETRSGLLAAIVFSEALGPPVALR